MNTDPKFSWYECSRAACGLRFPSMANDKRAAWCPVCKSPTHVVVSSNGWGDVPSISVDNEVPVELVLDNIRSAWNVGAIFRTADGAGVRKLHLCGITPTPAHAGVLKTSLGAEQVLPWEVHQSTLQAVRSLKEAGFRLWALEGVPQARMLFTCGDLLSGSPIALVAGNELAGVDPDVLAMCDQVVCLPMQGMKGSLNVAVACGAAMYVLRFGSLLK